MSKELKYIIYKATSPSGKVYIGQTSTLLQTRINGHIHSANVNKPWAFSKAIRKYGKENIKWEVIDNTSDTENAIILEKMYIQQFQSNNREFGYNLTIGGDGCVISSLETKLLKSTALKAHYASPQGTSTKETLSTKSKEAWQDPAYREATSQAIRKVRSSKESKQKTSVLSKQRYSVQEVKDKHAAVLTETYKDPTLRQKISEIGLKSRAKAFNVFKNGTLIGTWENVTVCGKELNIHYTGISRCLSGNLPSYKGYTFSRLESDTIDIK